MWLDSKGRILGKVNLFDLLVFSLLLCLGGTVAYAVSVSRFRVLEVYSIEPRRIIAGTGKHVMMKGTGFDPETTIRLGDYPDQGGVYFDESTIGIEITEKFNPDTYRVIVHDGRGRYTAVPHAIEVIWLPKIFQVSPRILYSHGRGAELLIQGDFFTDPCTVFIGKRQMEVLSVSNYKTIQVQLRKGEPPLGLGEQPVTVINKGNYPAVLEKTVLVCPPPEVHSLEPSALVAGQSAEIVFHGKHLRQGTRVWFGKHLVGEARFISPERLALQVPGKLELDAQDLFLDVPDGPKVLVKEQALEIRGRVPVLMVVGIYLDDESLSALESLQRLPAWVKRRPLKDLKLRRAVHDYFSRTLPVIEVVLPAHMEKGASGYHYYYRGEGGGPLRVGSRITLRVAGHKLIGTIASDPFAVYGDDLISDAKI